MKAPLLRADAVYASGTAAKACVYAAFAKRRYACFIWARKRYKIYWSKARAAIFLYSLLYYLKYCAGFVEPHSLH